MTIADRMRAIAHEIEPDCGDSALKLMALAVIVDRYERQLDEIAAERPRVIPFHRMHRVDPGTMRPVKPGDDAA